jgi:hypothetical protein
MKRTAIGRGWVAVLCSVILVGAGAVLATPVANAVSGINWSSAWTHQIQPRADQRYYTKAQATKRFAPKPKVIRGAYISQITVAAAGESLSADISFGWSVGTAPVVHVIAPGDTPPSGCSGTLAKPDAAPGNLCVFENKHFQATSPEVCNVASACGHASAMGAILVSVSTTPGATKVSEISGSWAVRPATTVTTKISSSSASRLGGPTGG